MAKRRIQRSPEKAPEQLTPEERREKRRRDRSAKGKHGGKGVGSPWRRAAVVGGSSGVVIAVVVVLVVFHPFSVPCLQFTANPSGTPAFPPHSTTDFSGTWCPGAALAVNVHSFVRLSINGQTVAFPDSIGRNTSYSMNGAPYECDLPLATHPPAPPNLPVGTIYLQSPWPYTYNLSDFFSVWSQSYTSVSVNSTAANRPIVYTTNDLLGYTPDSSHSIALYVDGQPAPAGPNLELNTLDYSPSPYPSCLGEVYGTGHTIALVYGPRGVTALTPSERTPLLATGIADPLLPLLTWDGPLPHFGGSVGASMHALGATGLTWLVLARLR
ncbi:MAG: hypothetical protein L3K23_04065 [Thermoplasmata archaeon]|nr:hypothetical protein [Thermoplasmata archaeon]